MSSYEESKDNAQFDILIANPPYSVNSFKSTIKYGEESFELFEKLTDNSSEIECLFIERMKQLLKIGGYAGIILPSSILTNTGIYTTTREILLKYFKIIAITGLTNEKIENLSNFGFDYLIYKPYSIYDLNKILGVV